MNRMRESRLRLLLYLHEVEGAAQMAFQILTIYDRVEEAVLQEKLRPLEAFRQLLADGLLDHPGAGETDQRVRFGDVEVAQHGKAGGHATGGGIGEHGDERHPGVIKASQGSRNFGQLHQAHDAFHHARTA